MVAQWQFAAPGRLCFGPGVARNVVQEVRRLGVAAAAVITGRRTAELAGPLVAALRDGGMTVHVMDGVPPEPTVADVERIRLGVSELGAQVAVVAVGGGSVLDTAKLAATLAGRPEPLYHFYGVDQVPGPGLPLIAIPTTAGTGSEVNGVAVVMDPDRRQKCGIVSPYLLPRVALVDPELTMGQPPELTAVVGVDALSHALEAYLSVHATPLSDQLALAAVQHIAAHLRRAVWRGDLESRTAMALGSTLAGMAFGQAGVGAAHALAYPLAGRYPLPHGLTVALLLPEVLAYNLPAQAHKVPALLAATGEPQAAGRLALGTLCRWLKDLLDDVGIPDLWRRSGVAVDMSTVEAMAAEAIGITRIMRNNPRPVGVHQARDICLRSLSAMKVPVLAPATAVPA